MSPPFAELPLPREITKELGRRPTGKLTHGKLRRRWLAAAALLALIVVAVVVCLAVARDTLYLALVAPLTGPSAAVGEEIPPQRRAGRRRRECRGGDSDGRQVALLVYDDQNTLNSPVHTPRRSCGTASAWPCWGTNSSAATLAGSEVYAAAGLPFVSATASADEVTPRRAWGFTTIFNNTAQGIFLATYIPHILGEHTISIVYGDDPYGQSLHDALTAALPPDVTVANTWRIDMGARHAEGRWRRRSTPSPRAARGRRDHH